jgi:hypothetical protein
VTTASLVSVGLIIGAMMESPDPLTYSVDALRHAILGTGHFPLRLDLGVMAAFLAIVLWIGSIAFRRMKV